MWQTGSAVRLWLLPVSVKHFSRSPRRQRVLLQLKCNFPTRNEPFTSRRCRGTLEEFFCFYDLLTCLPACVQPTPCRSSPTTRSPPAASPTTWPTAWTSWWWLNWTEAWELAWAARVPRVWSASATRTPSWIWRCSRLRLAHHKNPPLNVPLVSQLHWFNAS